MDNLFEQIISLENLFASWKEFRKGKRKKFDIQIFERNLEDELFKLCTDLKSKTYHHSNYTSFHITDPKLRHIHKAIVRDRIVHHAVYRILYPIFDQAFIYDSYSCRFNKGTHKAIQRLVQFSRKISKNYTRPCWALKLDIKKFFDSVDQEILLKLIKRKISDPNTLGLIENIIQSYDSRESSLTNSASSLQASLGHERERERERVLRLRSVFQESTFGLRDSYWQFNQPDFCQCLSK